MSKYDEAGKIEAFLKEQGWPVTRLAPNVLRSSFRGAEVTLPLVVQLEDAWVKMTVVPIVRMPSDGAKAEALYDRLLRLNAQIKLARFSLDEDGDVLLSVEFPSRELDASELRDALDVLTYFAETYQPEIKAIVA
jgi:hypothetical protein